MPKKGEPELRPSSPGTRVFLEDLEPGDILDLWSKRSGGFFLAEDAEVVWIRDNGDVVLVGGKTLHTDAGWGEVRRKGNVYERA